MKRLATASALLLASSGLVLAAAAPASAGISVPDLSLTHSPEPMTVGEVGTVTMTLSNNSSTIDDLNYTLTDDLPPQFTIGEVTDAGAFEGCEVDNTSHTVTCSAFISIEAGATESVTFQVTPTESGDFENDALYTYFVSTVSDRSKAHRSGLKPAGGPPIGGTAQDAIRVKAASTPTPTPSATPTPTPTHTPTHRPTHKPTHHPTPTPSASVKAVSASLPNTGGSDLGLLALVGIGLVALGGVISAAVRSRRNVN